jgi:hypothetical protein
MAVPRLLGVGWYTKAKEQHAAQCLRQDHAPEQSMAQARSGPPQCHPLAYGVITVHLHDNHWITPVKLENIHYYDSWQYLPPHWYPQASNQSRPHGSYPAKEADYPEQYQPTPSHWITPVKLENIHYYDSWQYLGFWGLAGIALGNLPSRQLSSQGSRLPRAIPANPQKPRYCHES